MDYGPEPFVIKIDWEAGQNSNYRSALWTGENMQVVLMSMEGGQKSELEIHDTDHFIRIQEGQGVVETGDDKNNLSFRVRVSEGYAIMIPAGIWHIVSNIGNSKLKLYVIYGPPQFPHGTIMETNKNRELVCEKKCDIAINHATSIRTVYFQSNKVKPLDSFFKRIE